MLTEVGIKEKEKRSVERKEKCFKINPFNCKRWNLRKVRSLWEGPLGTPLGLVHWKRASSPVEAGTTGYL